MGKSDTQVEFSVHLKGNDYAECMANKAKGLKKEKVAVPAKEQERQKAIKEREELRAKQREAQNVDITPAVSAEDVSVEDIADVVDELEEGTLKPLSDFKKKDDLETYGKEFGIDLNKSKTMANMYADLEAHIAKEDEDL